MMVPVATPCRKVLATSRARRSSCGLKAVMHFLSLICATRFVSCDQCTGSSCSGQDRTEHSGLETVISVMQAQQTSAITQLQGCRALKSMLETTEHKVRLLRAGGLQLILNTLDMHIDSVSLQELGLEILEMLVAAAEKEGWDAPVLKGVAYASLEAMINHRFQPSVQARSCSLLRRLGVSGILQQMDQPEEGAVQEFRQLIAPEMVNLVTTAMKDWGSSEEVQSECGILRAEAWFVESETKEEQPSPEAPHQSENRVENIADGAVVPAELDFNSNLDDAQAVEDRCRVVTEMASDEEKTSFLSTRNFARDVQHAMRRHFNDAGVQEACMLALWQLCAMPAVGVDVSRSVVQGGGVQAILSALELHQTSPAVQDFGCRALVGLAVLEEGHALAMEHGAPQQALAAITRFQHDPDVMEQAARVLVAMARDAPSRKRLDEAGVVEGVLQLFAAQGSDVRVREQGCHVLLALMVGGELRLERRQGAVGALLAVLDMHGGDFNVRLAAYKLLRQVAASAAGRADLVADERGLTVMVAALRVSGERGQDREVALQTLEMLSRDDHGQRRLAGGMQLDQVVLRGLREQNRKGGVVAMSEACWVLWRMGAVNASVLTTPEAVLTPCWWTCRAEGWTTGSSNRQQKKWDAAMPEHGEIRQGSEQTVSGSSRVGCVVKRRMMASTIGRKVLETFGERVVWGLRFEDAIEVSILAVAVLMTVLAGGVGAVWLLRSIGAPVAQRLQAGGGRDHDAAAAAAAGRRAEPAGGGGGAEEREWVEEGREGYCRSRVSVLFLAELQRSTNNFSEECRIGGGGFGSVFKVEQGLRGIGNGKALAVKRLDAGKGQGQGEFLQEIQVLGSLKHPHLLPLLAFSAESLASVCLVTPLMRGGSLEDRLLLGPGSVRRLAILGCPGADRGAVTPLSWRERVRICVGAGRGIAYLHHSDDSCGKPQILHRDVKAANIMLDHRGSARLCDAGLARVSNELRPQGNRSHVSSARLVGTHGFLDPAYMATGRMDAATDGYALGVTLMMALTGLPALDDDATEPLLTNRCHEALFGGRAASGVQDRRARWPQAAAEDMLEGARRLLHPVRGSRWSVAQVVAHLEAAAGLGDSDEANDVEEEAGARRAELHEGKECVMCMEEVRQVRFEACGHAVLCSNCYLSLLGSVDPYCPYCRGPISPASAPSDSIARQDTFVRQA